jgi:hypothetical protein
MRTALLTATALVVLSMANAQNQLPVPTAPNGNPVVDPSISRVRDAPGGGRLHYDVPCRVSVDGRCAAPQPPPYRPRH